MQIDWFTAGAQIVNFLVLVYLLKRFLYRPVIAAMSLRQRTIAERMETVERRLLEADRQAALYADKQRALEQQRAALLEQARVEAERERAQRLESLRQEITRKRVAWENGLARERETAARELRLLIGQKVMALGRTALAELAGVELEAFMVERFLERLAALPADQAQTLTRAIEQGQAVTVATAFALGDDQRKAICAALGPLRDGATPVFEQRPELVCGIALECGGRSWPWTIAHHLEAIERSVSEILSHVPVPGNHRSDDAADDTA